MPTRKYPKLPRRLQALTSKYIVEEKETRKYEPKQAVAIGISRARAADKKKKKRRR